MHGAVAPGRRQAEALRARLVETGELADAARAVCQRAARALETGAIVAAGIGDGSAPVGDCDLCELHPGEADGLTWDEFRDPLRRARLRRRPRHRGGARGRELELASWRAPRGR